MFGAKKPKESPEDKALKAAQLRELNRTQEQIDERKRRVLRSEYGGRASLLSGSERGIREGEPRGTRLSGGSSTPGRSPRSAAGAVSAALGLTRRAFIGGRRYA